MIIFEELNKDINSRKYIINRKNLKFNNRFFR